MLSFLKGKDKDRSESEEAPRSWTQRLRDGLAATREKLGGQLAQLFAAGGRIDEGFYEELETILLSCDVGVTATTHLIEATRGRVRKAGLSSPDEVRTVLKEVMAELVKPLEQPLRVSHARPFVILLCGVNGAGKTTSIGKLAHLFQAQGHSVLLAAGDTFRAAAACQPRHI
jgi:fused signal recognition particle receptor